MFVIFDRLYNSTARRLINHGVPCHRKCLHNENMPECSDYRDGHKERQLLRERGAVLPAGG